MISLIDRALDCPFGPALAFGLGAHLLLWYQRVGTPVLYITENGNDAYSRSTAHADETHSSRHVADIHSVLQQVPALRAPLIPPMLFYSGIGQLVPFLLESWWQERHPPCVWREELAELADGELVSLGWADVIPQRDMEDDTPFLIIHHGASGTTTDFPNQTYVLEARRRGWSVCVFNRRGHLRPLTKPLFGFFGSTADVRHVTEKYFRERRPRAPVFMLGISAGSGVLARYMGEQGLNLLPRDKIQGFCTAAFGVSPGYDIEKCFSRVKKPFDSILMKSGKALYLESNHELLKGCESYHACKNAENVQNWIDQTWSMGGHKSMEEFYEKTNPMRVIEFIREPFLCLNAEDDPLCVAENVLESVHYFDKREHNAVIAYTKTGGHCSFYELSPFNIFFQNSWSERVAFQFFDSVMNHIA